MMASIGIIIAMLVNVFFMQSSMFSLIASDCHRSPVRRRYGLGNPEIKEMYVEADAGRRCQGPQVHYLAPFALYGLRDLFVHVLNILGIWAANKASTLLI